MPPPPPPSKSYLIRIEDLSTDDEEDDHCMLSSPQQEDPALSSFLETASQTELALNPIMNNNNSQVVLSSSQESMEEDEKSQEENDQIAVAATQKKKKKRKKKKKTKSSKIAKKGVSFQSVSVFEFERCLGYEVVPGDGGWSLGMKFHHFNREENINIDRFEDLRRNRLVERWKVLPDELKSTNTFIEEIEGMPPKILETRQWDYRYKQKNPLFGMLTESQRMHALVGKAPVPASEKDSDTPSPKKKPTLVRVKERSFVEHFTEEYPQSVVRQMQNELEELRIARSGDSLGCTCRKLRVYIPPPNAGKKAAHKRLALKRVIEELDKRGARPTENCSRDDLEHILQDIVEKEPCCGPNCPCFSNGIECQQDTCSCWQISHQGDVKKSQSNSTAQTLLDKSCVQERCGNEYGIVSYDPNTIEEYRSKILKGLTCHVINEEL